jgi:hypothetical protein
VGFVWVDYVGIVGVLLGLLGLYGLIVGALSELWSFLGTLRRS